MVGIGAFSVFMGTIISIEPYFSDFFKSRALKPWEFLWNPTILVRPEPGWFKGPPSPSRWKTHPLSRLPPISCSPGLESKQGDLASRDC